MKWIQLTSPLMTVMGFEEKLMTQLSTSNIHKLTIIFGLIICLWSIVYPTSKTFKLKKELAVLVIEAEYASKIDSDESDFKIDKNLKLIGLSESEIKFYFFLGIISFLIGGFLVIYSFRSLYLNAQAPVVKQKKKD